MRTSVKEIFKVFLFRRVGTGIWDKGNLVGHKNITAFVSDG
ncbi:hypothetical protein Cpin_5726 [Chitinophaga pinensis DSM 2588]|uniref:Uncharacterized protein n=1 Tax=Chitinophaga pinensis (strain ATCC 43595 / DSM 2588 / LMG 13176 / NBRC 15968 / NCIMB 11800 / UQM 2034) TaxID=485918 RepID=A0A979G9H3_CHIPD|nr:hypothetical protein Cpin_5726 [Chitinophaga pinensis DSM 2588]